MHELFNRIYYLKIYNLYCNVYVYIFYIHIGNMRIIGSEKVLKLDNF